MLIRRPLRAELRLRLCAAGCLAWVGCAPVAPEGPAYRPDDAVVDTRDGERLSFEQAVGRALAARVIYVGETHDSKRDHRLQYDLLRSVYERDPSLAIGMEMFQRRFQPALDAYVVGEIDEDELLERTEYKKRWGLDWDFYRPFLLYARRHRLRVWALNASSELSHEVARVGLAALSEAQQKKLPEMALDNEAHRALVMAYLKEHPNLKPAMRERFYQAQVLWDETMGLVVAKAMSAPDAPQRMIVFAGRVHVMQGLGIPRCAERRGAAPFVTVVRDEGPSEPGPSAGGHAGDAGSAGQASAQADQAPTLGQTQPEADLMWRVLD